MGVVKIQFETRPVGWLDNSRFTDFDYSCKRYNPIPLKRRLIDAHAVIAAVTIDEC